MSSVASAAARSEAAKASDRPEPTNHTAVNKPHRSFGTVIAPYLFVAPAFIVVFVFVVLAALNTFRLAFTDSTLLKPGKFVGFQNFIDLFQDEYFRPFAVWCGWVCQVVTVLRSSLPQVR